MYFIDANALYGRLTRDILLSLAQAGLIEIRWSQYVLAELRIVLLRRPNATAGKIDRMLGLMQEAFPEATFEGIGVELTGSDFPDPKDVPIVAAAAGAGCSYILTNNVRDLPVELLGSIGPSPVTVDACLSELASKAGGEAAIVIDDWTSSQSRPPYTRATLLDHLERSQLKAFAIGFRNAWQQN